MKIRTSFLISSIFLSQLAFGQLAIKTTQFGVSVTPQLNTTVFKNKDEIDRHSTIGLAIAGSIHLDISPKTQLVTGFEFQYVKYSYQDYSGSWPNEYDSLGQYYPDKNYFDYQYALLFIGLPVHLKLKLNSPEKANHFFLAPGLAIRYRFGSGGDVSLVEDGTTTIKRGIDTFFWAPDKFWFLGTFGIGYEMKCGQNKFSISPTIEYSPFELYNDQGSSSSLFDAHPAFLGISFSYY